MKATIALAVLASAASMAAAAPAEGFTPAISFATPEHARTSRAAKKPAEGKQATVVTSGGECLQLFNNFRAQVGLPQLTYNSGAQSCADQQAALNLASGRFHTYFRMCGEAQQCEAYAFSLPQAIGMYVAEGPGGGHYQIISDPRIRSVACGTSGSRYTHNFYF